MKNLKKKCHLAKPTHHQSKENLVSVLKIDKKRNLTTCTVRGRNRYKHSLRSRPVLGWRVSYKVSSLITLGKQLNPSVLPIPRGYNGEKEDYQTSQKSRCKTAKRAGRGPGPGSAPNTTHITTTINNYALGSRFLLLINLFPLLSFPHGHPPTPFYFFHQQKRKGQPWTLLSRSGIF